MKSMLLCLCMLLSGCVFTPSKPISNLEAAKLFIFVFKDRANAEKHLDLAIQKEGSIEARILKARMILKDDFNQRENALPLIKPYITTHTDAALIYGLIYYPHNDAESFFGFEHAARMGHPTAMHYLASHYHHVLKDDEEAIFWAQKSMRAGCSLARSYISIMGLDPSARSDFREETQKYLANFKNGFEHTIMMGEALFNQYEHEHAYWKRRALASKAEEIIRLETPVYDFQKDCNSPFSQELFNLYRCFDRSVPKCKSPPPPHTIKSEEALLEKLRQRRLEIEEFFK